MARTFSSLRAYFVEAYRPLFLVGSRTANVAIYETTLAFWELLLPELPLDAITNQWVGTYRTKLAERGLSPHTTNKYLRALNAMLRKAGPVGPHNREGLGLIETPPWVKELKTPVTRPRAIPLERLGLIYRACDVARVPKADGIDSTEWWRGLIVCASQIGLRRQALVNGITFAMFETQVERSHGLPITVTLKLPAELDKCGVERRKPVSAIASQHVERQFELRRRPVASAPEDVVAFQSVFLWPYKSRRGFDITWHAIQDAAGIPKDEHYKFHDLKKTFGTELGRHANSHVVMVGLDHSSTKTSEHYCDGGAELRQAVERMQYPAEFDGLHREDLHHGGTEPRSEAGV